MTKTLSLTLAQYRMMGRLIRGLSFPLRRYHTGTIKALERKRCADLNGPHAGAEWHHWHATKLGRDVYAAHGKLRPTNNDSLSTR